MGREVVKKRGFVSMCGCAVFRQVKVSGLSVGTPPRHFNLLVGHPPFPHHERILHTMILAFADDQAPVMYDAMRRWTDRFIRLVAV
jgi:hypothetical protein